MHQNEATFFKDKCFLNSFSLIDFFCSERKMHDSGEFKTRKRKQIWCSDCRRCESGCGKCKDISESSRWYMREICKTLLPCESKCQKCLDKEQLLCMRDFGQCCGMSKQEINEMIIRVRKSQPTSDEIQKKASRQRARKAQRSDTKTKFQNY